jgi:integrase
MPRRGPRSHVPKYRHYKPKDLAVVRIDGRDHYLGPYGSEASREQYRRLIARWLTTTRPTQGSPSAADSGAASDVNAILLAFWQHAQQHYRNPDGSPSRELGSLREAIRPLRQLHGGTLAREFGPLALRALRDAMVRRGWARTTVNARIDRVRRIFRWAASVELVPASVPQALATVEGLRRGRSEAPEPKGVHAVPAEVVEATLPHLPRPVAAMARLQLLTGMRPGEVMAMRGCDLVPGEPLWEYRPAAHKTAWRGQDRIIPLGPQARAIIREFLRPDPSAYLFDPREAVAHAQEARRKPGWEDRARRAAARRPQRPGRPRARLNARYSRYSYLTAITRACDRAFPHPTLGQLPAADLSPAQAAELQSWRRQHRWHPNQLRHTAATLLRSRFGLETAQTVLGHVRADVTQIYAERDLARAREAMARIG